MQDPILILILGSWSWDPVVILILGGVAALYARQLDNLRRQGLLADLTARGLVKSAHPLYFAAGLFVLLISLQSPIDTFSGVLFSIHMTQHLLLTLVAPPLLLLGLPEPLLKPIIENHPLVKRIVATLTQPPLAILFFNLALLMWHVPELYELTLRNNAAHDLEHAMFFWTAMISWWPILSPLRSIPRLSYPGQMLYIFVLAIPGGILGAWLVFTRALLYPSYAATPMLWQTTALADQQFGGLLMMIPGKMVYFLALTIIFFRWFNFQEQPAGQRPMP